MSPENQTARVSSPWSRKPTLIRSDGFSFDQASSFPYFLVSSEVGKKSVAAKSKLKTKTQNKAHDNGPVSLVLWCVTWAHVVPEFLLAGISCVLLLIFPLALLSGSFCELWWVKTANSQETWARQVFWEHPHLLELPLDFTLILGAFFKAYFKLEKAFKCQISASGTYCWGPTWVICPLSPHSSPWE